MLDFKISLVTLFLLSLIIPFLINPINGLYDIGELQGLKAYCFLHAERAAKGENVVNDLIKSGLAKSTYYDWSCIKISETLEAEEQRISEAQQAESARELAYANDCKYGNLTPSQYWECDRAGYSPEGIYCLFEEDRELFKERLSEGETIPRRLDFGSFGDLDLNRAEPLTSGERLECLNAGHEPELGKDKDTEQTEDKDSEE